MDALRLPSPDPTNSTASDQPPRGEHADHTARDSGEARSQPRIKSVEECLVALSQIPSLLLMGVINVKIANAMRSIYQTILQQQANNPTSPAIDVEGLGAIVRKAPELIEFLSPFSRRSKSTSCCARRVRTEMGLLKFCERVLYLRKNHLGSILGGL
jgi:hypothetical protein